MNAAPDVNADKLRDKAKAMRRGAEPKAPVTLAATRPKQVANGGFALSLEDASDAQDIGFRRA